MSEAILIQDSQFQQKHEVTQRKQTAHMTALNSSSFPLPYNFSLEELGFTSDITLIRKWNNQHLCICMRPHCFNDWAGISHLALSFCAREELKKKIDLCSSEISFDKVCLSTIPISYIGIYSPEWKRNVTQVLLQSTSTWWSLILRS